MQLGVLYPEKETWDLLGRNLQYDAEVVARYREQVKGVLTPLPVRLMSEIGKRYGVRLRRE